VALTLTEPARPTALRSVRCSRQAEERTEWCGLLRQPQSVAGETSRKEKETHIHNEQAQCQHVWSWAKDSGMSRQDLWEAYPPELCVRLEQALVGGEQRVNVDDEGRWYVDLSNPKDFVQRVAARPNLRRKVKREAKGVAVQVLAAQAALCGVQVSQTAPPYLASTRGHPRAGPHHVAGVTMHCRRAGPGCLIG
jgi:hypothetical protein